MDWLINSFITIIWYPWVHPGRSAFMGFVALFVWMAIRDFSQKTNPIKRNFVHVDDLVDATLIALQHHKARQQLFHICMDEPVDYGEVAAHLAQTRQLPSVDIPTDYASTWLDNAKARFLLDWRPQYDLARLIDTAFDYQRDPEDPRTVWYPG